MDVGLSILAWALQRREFPPHDQKVDPIEVTNALGFLDESAKDLLTFARLRHVSELQAAREWFYDVHCTLRSFLHYGGDGRLATWISDFLQVLNVPRHLVMGDGFLTIDGKPLVEAERARAEAWESVVCERHRATIWLVGEEPAHTEISVDT